MGRGESTRTVAAPPFDAAGLVGYHGVLAPPRARGIPTPSSARGQRLVTRAWSSSQSVPIIWLFFRRGPLRPASPLYRRPRPFCSSRSDISARQKSGSTRWNGRDGRGGGCGLCVSTSRALPMPPVNCSAPVTARTDPRTATPSPRPTVDSGCRTRCGLQYMGACIGRSCRQGQAGECRGSRAGGRRRHGRPSD
jgi:hypothetical protein